MVKAQWEGGCLCGAVRFRATGQPQWVAWCHCESCRRHSGGPVSVFVAFPEAEVETTHGAVATFRSSPGTVRGFCATCGSTLTCQGDARPGELHIHVGAFDDAPALAPSFHIYPEERLPWLCLAEPAQTA
ncbi:GFA family protein [Phenylobacterium sp.]|uniref:GFA family protein n=1 Tax=Phenylobacterium sp. TaxID=1871053 RepID=UPI003BAA8A7A